MAAQRGRHHNAKPPASRGKGAAGCRTASGLLLAPPRVTDITFKTKHVVLLNCKETKPYGLSVSRREEKVNKDNIINICHSLSFNPSLVLVILLYSDTVGASL